MSMRRWIAAAAAVLLGIGAAGTLGADQLESLGLPSLEDLPGVSSLPSLDPQPTWTSSPAAPTGQAAEQLAGLATTEAAPPSAYTRDAFGQRWADIDRDGCDQRNNVLGRDLDQLSIKPGTNGCKVLAGTLVDPYTGQTIAFSSEDPQAVQVDHIVSLSNAWDSGAWAWTPDQRERYANDLDNLLAVDGPTNQAKSDHDASEWLPASAAAKCALVERQVAVKASWGLSVSARERAVMGSVLRSCSGG